MKKTLILAVLGLIGGVVSSYGQGAIALDSYSSTANPVIKFGGSAIGAGYTVGIYYVAGNVVGSVGADATGFADPSTLGGGLVLATGAGTTAPFVGNTGLFSQPTSWLIQPSGAVLGTYTLEVVAYNGSDYLNSTIRGHSSAFSITAGATTSPTPVYVGDFMSSFSVFNVTAVPEPTTVALAGLGLASLALIRRRK